MDYLVIQLNKADKNMNWPEFEIRGRKIGYRYDPLVIAELGINHGGSLKVAMEMVDAACDAGVEIIKHQTHIVSDEMSSQAKKVIPGNAKESIYEIMEQCALSEEEEIELQRYVESKGIIFISTPFSRAAAERLKKMDIPAYKIGSGECNNYPLINHIASFGKPIILSTGMNTIESIRKAVAIFESFRVPYALLHCTNVYPTPPHLVRLGAIAQLASEFPNAVLGLSDHTVTNTPCLGAVAVGASILERHFTDHMNRVGPDIICSMDKEATRELIVHSRIMKQARGGEKGPVAEEKPTIDFAYASVVTIGTIKKGERFTMDNLWVKRPGTGEIKAVDFEKIIGKTAARDMQKDEQLVWNDIIQSL
jgi:sialic acid synthase SpsE